MNYPDYLYHYTKLDTLNYIFKDSKKVELRFTDYRYLNDVDEGKYLLKFLKRRTNDLKNILSSDSEKYLLDCILNFKEKTYLENKEKFFIMSFSEVEDSTQFWLQDYAKDKGICLRMNVKNYFENKKEWTIPTFHPVLYLKNNEDLLINFNDFINEIRKESSDFTYPQDATDLEKRAILFPGLPKNFDVKSSVWKSEQEWRLEMLDFEKYKIKNDGSFEIDNSGVPRFKLYLEVNPFDEIILGPSFSDSYIESVKEMLTKKGYPDINVIKSDANCQ
ncbi:MAG: DUF2971 domain-containing protein [Fibrobacter sp.]|nr:DUF2971 domain-containing protein [Fibrobacter sp.]